MEIPESSALKTLKKNIESSIDVMLTKNSELDENPNISKEKFDNIVENLSNSKEIDLIKRKFFEYYNFYESERPDFVDQLKTSDMYDETPLENLCFLVTQSKSIENKVKGLQCLLRHPVLDLVDKQKWPRLSKLLRETLLSKNKDIFTNSFQIYVKLSTHPDAVIDATANILKVLNTQFQSRKICTHVSSIDLKNPLHEQILYMSNLVVKNFKTIFSNYNKEKNIEHLLVNFLNLTMIHLSYDRIDYIHFFYYLYVLDPKAKWFHQITFNLLHRKIVMNYCLKNCSFFKYIIKEVLHYINNEYSCPKTSWKTEISLEIIKYVGFHHCCNILSTILSFNASHKLFPVDIKNVRTLEDIVMIFITAIPNFCYFKQKHNVLIETVKTILINNRHLLYNKDISLTLIKPFLLKTQEKQKLADIAYKNSFVFDIVNTVCNTNDAFFIIFGFGTEIYLRKYKRNKHQYIKSISLHEPYVMSTFIEKYSTDNDYVSFGKVIIDFTTTFIRYQISSGCTNVKQIVYDLLDCCCNIYLLHNHVINLVNTEKLLQISLSFYKVLINKNMIMNGMNSLLRYFMIVCETRYGIDLFLKEDSELLYILCKHYFFIFDSSNLRSFAIFLGNMASTIPGCIAIAECRKQIISPYFHKIWKLDEDELMYLSGSEHVLTEEMFKYFRFVFILHFNFCCIHTILSEEVDDESTLVETDQKSTCFKDLIDEALIASGPGTLSCYIGLYTIRILINNLDNLIFLENALDLKKQIDSLQSECVNTEAKSSDTSIVIDECSLMRNAITDFIFDIGDLKIRNNKNKNSRNSTISGRNRRLNDLQKFLNDTRNNLHDHNWLLQVRKIFKQTCGLVFKESSLVDLIQQMKFTVHINKSYFIWPENDQKLNELFPEDYTGIMIIIKFGRNNKLLLPPTPHEEILALLLKQVNSYLNINRDKFEGFDWFVGVIFLICNGNIERCKLLFQSMVQLPVGPYIWPALGLQLGQIKKFDYNIYFDHTLNLLIGDLEIFKPSLENSGISWNFIVQNWINQCFFNVLEWNELCNYLVIAILFPIDYLLFFIVCCAQHLESRFLTAITCNNIDCYINILQLDGFHLTDYFSSLEQLAKQYKNILTKY